jgi:hypothetical protein
MSFDLTSDPGATMGVRSPAIDYLARADLHARHRPAGFGAAVTNSTLDNGGHIWDAVVTDGHELHYEKKAGEITKSLAEVLRSRGCLVLGYETPDQPRDTAVVLINGNIVECAELV